MSSRIVPGAGHRIEQIPVALVKKLLHNSRSRPPKGHPLNACLQRRGGEEPLA